MLDAIKHQTRGFVVGVFVTILVIGCAHIEIRFSRGPEAFELSQNEKVAEQLEHAMPVRTTSLVISTEKKK